MSDPVMRRLIITSRRFARRLTAFGADARGLGAVEFAMILPVMLVTLFGVISVTSVVSIHRKMTLVARTLSDLTSQGSSIDENTDIDNFEAIGVAILSPYKAVLNPFSGGPLRMTITEVYIDPNSGAPRVLWSKGDAPRAKNDEVTSMPADLIRKGTDGKVEPNQFFILGETSYHYASSILPDVAALPLKASTYTRPRVTSSWPCVRWKSINSCNPKDYP